MLIVQERWEQQVEQLLHASLSCSRLAQSITAGKWLAARWLRLAADCWLLASF